MREVEKTIIYELTPEERDTTVVLEREVARHISDGWSLAHMPRLRQMKFDANYNRYYAKVIYERTS